MLIFLLSLGGIPFVAGFWAKLYVFWAALERGLYGLVFLGAVLTVVALYCYLLVARRMYIDAPERRNPVAVPSRVRWASRSRSASSGWLAWASTRVPGWTWRLLSAAFWRMFRKPALRVRSMPGAHVAEAVLHEAASSMPDG